MLREQRHSVEGNPLSESELRVPCPACNQSITIPANWVGKRRPCPSCKEWVTMPAATPPAVAPASASAATPAASASPAPGANAENAAAPDKPLSFAERMKLAAERGTTQIRRKEEERARREASRGPASDLEARTRATKPDAVVGAGAASPAGGEGPAAGATRDWGRAPQSAEDEQRRQEREDKLREASYAPEKIGRMSVVLCGIALLIGAISLVVLCFGVGTAGATATMGAQGQTHPGFAGGAIMSFGVCMFGFAPICAVCGFILGVHSVMRSRHDKLWGALGTGLNGILVIPFVIGCLMTLLSLHK